MNRDPFAQFMDFWVPTLGIPAAFDAWLAKSYVREAAYVMPDISPFKSNDGAYIAGRREWREHLKQNDLVELGMSDMRSGGEKWEKRKQAQEARVKRGGATAQYEPTPTDFQPQAPTRLQVEMANRLHGRPAPARKELIKLALDQAKRMKRG